MRALLNRFQGRPDSEHEQAIVRLVIAGMIVLYLGGLLSAESGLPDERRFWGFWIMLAESLLGLGILIGIVLRPGASRARRVIGMLGDYGTLAGMMALHGAALSPLYILYLWVTIGNGLRYGTRYLFAAIGLAVLSFTVVLLVSDYWQHNLYLGIGLLVGLVAIPGYLASLMRELTRASEEARSANAAKTRFLANMSHEFRSPLNGIIGMAELLSSMRLAPEQREAAEVIQTSAQSLLLLVEDVLDISAIEAGKLRISEEDFNLQELGNRLQLMFGHQATARGLAFSIEIPRALPTVLRGDPAHLTQVLVNLISNAIKFTDRGRVVLEVTKISEGPDSVDLRFAVRDTGPGIPAAERERIFRPFERIDDTHTRRVGGTGLGTTIARTLTELMGGRIGLQDNPGGGSVFWVELRFETRVGAEAGGPGAQATDKVIAFDDPFVRHRARVRPMRVLIADDQEANRIVLQRVLERGGHRVVLANDGREALDRLEDGGLDLAILDLHMPEFSGIEVIKQTRVMQAGQQSRTPIVALSADATLETVRETERAGAFAFLTKPVVVARLLEVLAEVAGAGRETRVTEGGERAQPLRLDVLEELAAMNLGPEFLQEFVDQCLRDASRCASEIERAGAGTQWENVREAAHALKGVSENLGAQGVSELALQLMRSSDAVLRNEWRARIGRLSELLETVARQARTEVARLTGKGVPADRPDWESS